MEKNKEIFLKCFEEYKEELKNDKERNCERNSRDTYKEARGFLFAALTFGIIEPGEGENEFLNYCNQLSKIYYDKD